MLQIGELIGDLIQAFGFHWCLFFGSGIDCCDYTRHPTRPWREGGLAFPMLAGIPYDRARLVSTGLSIGSIEGR